MEENYFMSCYKFIYSEIKKQFEHFLSVLIP